MSLRRLQVSDFRCLAAAELHIDPCFTLVSGPNASGKTSVLEAVHVLGRGRSFRTRRLDTLIRANTERFTVFGEVEAAERRVAVGVEGSTGGVRAKMAGERVASPADLATILPVQIIDPEVHRLIEEGPSRRRRYLDWGVFHVEHAFLSHWQQYQTVLRQRNAALKSRQARGLVKAWDGELIRLGVFIDAARKDYIGQLTPIACDLVRSLLGLELTLLYRSGWAHELSLEAALAAGSLQEQDAGITLVGPQRAELSLRLNGIAVKDRISRGQQKLLAAALLIAQLSLFPLEGSVRPTLLLDDPAAELDTDRLFGLIREVQQQSAQLMVTSLTEDFDAFGSPGRRYRIKAGIVTET